MQRFKFILAVALSAVLVSVLSWAQTTTTANQGKPGTQGPWPVTVAGGSIIIGSSDGGVITIVEGTHGACTNTTMNVGTTGTNCPTSALAGRSSILIQLNQNGETLRITENGVAATSTTGVKIGDGATFTDNLAASANTSCRCTAATCEVVIVECP